MKFAICNEMFKGWEHRRMAACAAAAGYEGVEVAPFTLGAQPAALTPVQVGAIRREFEAGGLRVMGLHWLLAGTEGLSITSPDDEALFRTKAHLTALIGLCRDLGGEVMVFGSPKQRLVAPGQNPEDAFRRAVRLFQDLALVAAPALITLCFEPLTAAETNFGNTMAEGVRLVEAVRHPAVKLHLDVKAMRGAEPRSPAETVLAEGGKLLHHFHANDPNLLGPGMGPEDQAPIGAALKTIGYDRWVSVETFVDGPGPEAIATQSMASLRRHYA